MFDILTENLVGPQALIAALTASAVFVTVVMLARPLFARDVLNRRMRSVATERERIRGVNAPVL